MKVVYNLGDKKKKNYSIFMRRKEYNIQINNSIYIFNLIIEVSFRI